MTILAWAIVVLALGQAAQIVVLVKLKEKIMPVSQAAAAIAALKADGQTAVDAAYTAGLTAGAASATTSVTAAVAQDDADTAAAITAAGTDLAALTPTPPANGG